MILLTRLNGTPFAVNADLIERVEVTPDTLLVLVDGKKYLVAESAQEVIDKVVAFRASVMLFADEAQRAAEGRAPASLSETARALRGDHERRLHLVPGNPQEG